MSDRNPHAVNVHVDGSSKHYKGGFGIVIQYPDGEEKEAGSDCYGGLTNNATELLGVVDAIKLLMCDEKAKKVSNWDIWTDSSYVCDNYKNALSQWLKNGYKKSDGHSVSNKNIWKDFVSYFRKSQKRIEIKWEKGHAGNQENERADRIAGQSREFGGKNMLYNPPKQIGRWLKIPENITPFNKRTKTFTYFVVLTKKLSNEYSVKVQILKPKKYMGKRIDQNCYTECLLNRAHVYRGKIIIKQERKYKNFIITSAEDLGIYKEYIEMVKKEKDSHI